MNLRRRKTLFVESHCIHIENANFLHSKQLFVAQSCWATDEEIERAIDSALEAGYRHIDTAYVYMNEAAIGRALKKWLDSGKIKREDLFIVTKLPNFGNRPDSVAKYLKRSLTALQLDYIDLYLMHHPAGLQEREGEMLPRDKNGLLLLDKDTDIVAVWKALEAQVDNGLIHSIGLSNFNSNQIHRIFKAARIKPVNLQIELHLYFQQRELVAFCKALDITVCAYAPIGSPGLAGFVKMIGDDPSLIPKLSPMDEPAVVEIANKHNKLPAQVLLRHTIQRGIAVIPKSSNPDRIKQNIDILDFKLSDDEVAILDALDKGHKGRLFGDHMLKGLNHHPEYPYNASY